MKREQLHETFRLHTISNQIMPTMWLHATFPHRTGIQTNKFSH